MSGTIITVSLTVAVKRVRPGSAAGRWIISASASPPQQQFSYIVPPGPGTGLGVPQWQSRRLWMGRLRCLSAAGRRPHGRVLLPAVSLSAPPGQLFPGTFFNPLRDPGPAIHSVLRCGRGTSDGRAADGFVASARIALCGRSGDQPVVTVPRLNGRIESPPLPSGGSGLTP